MNNTQALEIVEFLGKYNEHFTELFVFLGEKQNKVLADDILWLHESLTTEQKLAMMGNSLENKRLEMMERLGFSEYTSSKLLEICPEEFRGRLKLECTNIENTIGKIKQLNADILETVEKKMAAAEGFLRDKGILATDVYDEAGAKHRLNNPDDDIIGSV
ncbi:MAG: flagellar protein FlgN [Oscillospiraceae bacterium]|nr:flagellar protein FlgN [Oscillospiraceae bacterium]